MALPSPANYVLVVENLLDNDFKGLEGSFEAALKALE